MATWRIDDLPAYTEDELEAMAEEAKECADLRRQADEDASEATQEAWQLIFSGDLSNVEKIDD